MKFRIFWVGLCLVAASPVFARNSVDDAVVDDVYGLASLFFEQQYRFLPISPPSEKVFVQSYDIAVPVDWKHFPKAFTKGMYAQMFPHIHFSKGYDEQEKSNIFMWFYT